MNNFLPTYNLSQKLGSGSLENKMLAGAMAILAVFLIVVYGPGENAYILIHDNLDSVVACFKILNLHKSDYFRLSATIPNLFNGVPISCLSLGINIGEIIYLLVDPLPAIIINETIARMVAFWGMFLLLKQNHLGRHPSITVGVSLCFALLPFWPAGFLCVAGQPLLLYSFLEIRARRERPLHWLIIVVFPLYSSLALSGFALIVLLFMLLVVDIIRFRKVSITYVTGLCVLCGFYFVANYRLIWATVVDSGFISHRTLFQARELCIIDSLGLILKNFCSGQYHAASMQDGVILITVSVSAVFLMLRRKSEYIKLFFLFLFSCLTVSIFYGVWKFLKPHLPNHLLLTGFQWERLHFLHPMLWHLLFAVALCILLETTHKYQRLMSALILLLIALQALHTIQHSHSLQEKNRNGITFAGFYSEELFTDIASYIGQKKDSYRVASIGLHPGIPQYNGFYTVDGYLSNYPLDYKIGFRKIIAQELLKSSRLKRSFDTWGSRCYLFSSEIGYFFINQKESHIVIKNLDINTNQFKAMGGKYIFSAAPIINHQKNGLKFLKTFEKDHLPWRIWLYMVTQEAPLKSFDGTISSLINTTLRIS